MIHDPHNLARSLIEAAVELDQAEARIKQEIVDAANVGDTRRIVEIMARWQNGPASEVLDALGVPRVSATVSESDVGITDA